MTDKTILIVDDEDSIRNLFKAALEQKGYRTAIAASAEQALDLIEGNLFGLYFLDLSLPGMSGIDLCRRILEKQPAACAYAITGYASNYKSEECLKAGFKAYLTKPVSLHVLFDIAHKTLKH